MFVDFDFVKNSSIELIELIKEERDVEVCKSKILDLWRSLDTLEEDSSVLLVDRSFDSTDQSLLYLLVHHLVENDCLDVVEQFQKEYSSDYLNRLVYDHKLYRTILKDIKNNNFLSLQAFIDQNSGESYILKYYIAIYKFLTCSNQKDSLAILFNEVSLYSKNMANVSKKYLKHLIFKDNIEESISYIKMVLENLFVREYSKLKLTNEYDFLKDLFLVGSSAYKQLQGITVTNIDEDDNILPVEIKLPKGCNYHSLFVCPVLKVLCGEDNKPVLLSCNHVISLNAANVLLKFGNSDTFKCPYCPEMCSSKSILILEL
ncbi:E3 ubiquitin-protein ligase RMND5A [Nosema granulosis]|uniref:E3 ubiquitin-protein ligase RMND5A n=1 Tax=Nosema granulosis TaxID=83296 RepID=A0A9P6GZU8_9MICR|nr:E3 ubiquitin-protein ligase RMND5A [Nosema granulosis]